MFIKGLVVLCGCLISFNSVDARTCKVLALSAGGDKGAYQAGAIYGLLQHGNPKDFQWDIVSGISVGSVNALSSLFFKIGDERKWADYLKGAWYSLTKKHVYKSWPRGVAQGIFQKRGMFNTSPLEMFIRTELQELIPKDRKISISASDVITGELRTWTEKNTWDELVKAVMASSAVPGIFPSIFIENTEYVDGGLSLMIDILYSSMRCITEGIAESMSEIVIDVIGCSQLDLGPIDTSNDTTLDVVYRARKAISYHGSIRLVKEALANFPQATFRHILFPLKPLKGFALGFEHEKLVEHFEIGAQDAAEWLDWRGKAYGTLEKVPFLSLPSVSLSPEYLSSRVFSNRLTAIDTLNSMGMKLNAGGHGGVEGKTPMGEEEREEEDKDAIARRRLSENNDGRNLLRTSDGKYWNGAGRGGGYHPVRVDDKWYPFLFTSLIIVNVVGITYYYLTRKILVWNKMKDPKYEL